MTGKREREMCLLFWCVCIRLEMIKTKLKSISSCNLSKGRCCGRWIGFQFSDTHQRNAQSCWKDMGTINRLHRFHFYLTRSLGCTPSSRNHCKPIYPHVIIQMFSCESHDGMLTSLISFAFASIAISIIRFGIVVWFVHKIVCIPSLSAAFYSVVYIKDYTLTP